MRTTASGTSFLDILDRTFRIYRENFVPIVGFVALVSIPIALVNLLLSRSLTTRFASGLNAGSPVLSSIAVLILTLVQILLIYSVVTYVTSESYLGRKASIGEAFRATRSRLANMGCSIILFYLLVAVMVFAIVFVTAVCNPAIVGIVFAVYAGLATFALLTPVLVLEKVRASTGINRAYGLGRARFWTIAIVLTLIYVIIFVLNIALGSVIGLLGIPTLGDPLAGTQLISTLATTVIGILTTPLIPIATTLLYYDARTRTEGLDLALAIVDTPNPRPSDIVSPAPAPFLNSRDLINMLILGVGGVALSVVAGGLLSGIIESVAPGLNLRR